MYERSVLIAEVYQEIYRWWENLCSLPNEEEEKSMDIRLQLVDGTYYVHAGDIQNDTDSRGAWGYGSITDSELDFHLLTNEIVDQALDDLKSKQVVSDG